MTKKIYDFYTPVKANQLLKDRFNTSPLMLEIIDSMSINCKCVFAALCDGYKITTIGYTIPADIFIIRASAVIHILRKLNLPITSASAPALSDSGNETKQTIFYMERSAIKELTENPKRVIARCKKEMEEKKLKKAKKDIQRIYNDFGEKKIKIMVEDVIKTGFSIKLNRSKK